MKISEIRKLAKMAEKMGIRRLKLDDLEFEFFQKQHEAKVPRQTSSEAPVIESTREVLLTDQMPDDEDFLYMSSGFDPKAEKKKEQETKGR